MNPTEPFADERTTQGCAFCGALIDATKDHIPPRVFLEKPYPANPPYVYACRACNQASSLDEEYVACLIECAYAGAVSPARLRSKIARILERKPSLASRLEQALLVDAQESAFVPERARVEAVLVKIVRGHALWELHLRTSLVPSKFWVAPFALLSSEQRREFEEVPVMELYPEVGSRSFQRMLVRDAEQIGMTGWQVVQENRYRFLASANGVVFVRIVIGEYLACEARWH